MTKIPTLKQNIDSLKYAIPATTTSGSLSQSASDTNNKLDQALAFATADRTALLTELRESGLLEVKGPVEQGTLKGQNTEWRQGHNHLARAIKAHINNLINPGV